jgi:hypothetical protein
MKSITMLLAASAAVLALNTSGALSQNSCSNEYVGCIDKCVSRPPSLQDRCIETCQSMNGQCNEKIYGVRRESTPAPALARQPQGEAASAQARRAPAAGPRDVEAPAREVEAAAPRQVEVPARAVPQAPPRR